MEGNVPTEALGPVSCSTIAWLIVELGQRSNTMTVVPDIPCQPAIQPWAHPAMGSGALVRRITELAGPV